MKAKFIIQVAPLIRLPLSKTQVFSYGHSDEIPPGSLVSIPFRFQIISGIVYGGKKIEYDQAKIKLKNVRSILEKSLLGRKQMQFAWRLAEYYIAPIGPILKAMLPQAAKPRKIKEREDGRKSRIIFQKEATKILSDNQKEIILAGSRRKRQEINLSLVKKMTASGGQCLYLASEIISVWSAYEKFKDFFPSESVALFYSGMPKGQYYEDWNKVRKGEIKLIISTKIGVFLPFKLLKLIIVDEEQDKSFKQWDKNPRYSAVKAGSMLTDIHSGTMVYSDSIPSLAAIQKKKSRIMKIYNFPLQKKRKSEIRIVSSYPEKDSSDFPLTQDIMQRISIILEQKKKILLMVARRGYSNFSVCKICKNVLKCPQCKRALVYFEGTGKYCCLHCSYKIDLLTACPACGACNFSHLGAGIDLVEKKIKRFFPSAQILKITRDMSKNENNRKIIMEKIKNSEVILGTQIALKIGDLQEFELVGFVNFDDLAGYPDYNSNEISYSLLSQGLNLTTAKGTLLVQTFFPDSKLVKNFSLGHFEIFSEQELDMRKKMNYPPYSRLIKLIYREKSKSKTESETKKVFDLLQRLGNNNIEVSEPYEPLVSSKRGYFYKNLLLKTNPSQETRNLTVYSALKSLGKGWVIDVDPVNTT